VGTIGYPRVRYPYVALLFRRQGVARCLVSRALSVARGHYATVRVRTDNPGAAVFHETLGFATATSSREATHELEMAGGVRRPTTRCS
jgi:GNAT superfamily N-acetyltransferase